MKSISLPDHQEQITNYFSPPLTNPSPVIAPGMGKGETRS